MYFVNIVSFSAALVVLNHSLIFALSFKSKTNILIKILFSLKFKHRSKEG